MILALDTALGACSAAVMSGDAVLAQEHRQLLRGHAEELAPMVERVMRLADIHFDALRRIGVTTGPGTFTGQRVGLAFARALGIALRIPVVGVTTLEAMGEEALKAFPTAKWAIVASDAKRGEVYLGIYNRQGEAGIAPRLGAIVDVPAAADPFFPAVLAGTAAPLLQSRFETAGKNIPDTGIRQPSAIFVALIAAKSLDLETAKPLYLRASDARIPVQT